MPRNNTKSDCPSVVFRTLHRRKVASAESEEDDSPRCAKHRKKIGECRLCMREEFCWKRENGWCTIFGCWGRAIEGLANCEFHDDQCRMAKLKGLSHAEAGRGVQISAYRPDCA